MSNNVIQFVRLRNINESLATENATLRNELSQFGQRPDSLKYDSIRHYNFVSARVINNSVDLRNNLITLNVGSLQGIKKDMGVIGNGSVIGKTRYVSENFTVVTSLLHAESMIPARIKNKVNICTVQWDGTDPYSVDLLYVPRHYSLENGDTVLTSGYSGIFPEDVQIGTISSIELSEDALFFDIKVKLATDFYKIAFVEVVENVERIETDSLENMVK